MALVAIIVAEVMKYRRDQYMVVTVLKKRGDVRGLDLVKRYKVSRAHVYLILSDLERRGYVQRLGEKPPYLYRWRSHEQGQSKGHR